MKQQGYVLVSLLLILFLLASVSLILNREGGMSVQLAADERSVSEAEQVALAGINHQIWRAAQTNCAAYTDVATTAFGDHSYSATISPVSGSPVHISATALLADGSTHQVERFQQVIHQPTKPEVTMTTQDGSGKDTRISSYAQGNHGSESTLYATGDYSGTQSYPLFEFDLSSIPTNIHIQEAQLSIRLTSVNLHAATGEISTHRVLTPWTENGADYNTSDGSTAWSFPPPMDHRAFSTTVVQDSVTGRHNWDITELVQQWVSGSVPNYGVGLISSAEVHYVGFDSKENGFSPLKPTLTIRYTCECGEYCDSFVSLPEAVAHWKLDETSGTTAEDAISDNDGVAYGSTWDVGQVAGSASFNGASDYIDVPHDNDLSFKDTLSISTWIRLEVSATGTYSSQTIIGKGYNNETEEYWFGVWENELEFGILDDGDWYGVNTVSLSLEPDRWYHAAVTFSDQTNEVNIYLDGVKRKTGKITENLREDNESVWIGKSLYGEHWYGNLDDIRLFDFVLSPEEVEALAVSGGVALVTSETVADSFESEVFNGSTGSRAWSGDWIEIGESNGAASGDIRVFNDGDSVEYADRNFVFRLRDNDNGGEGIEREADLQDCATARFGFVYRRKGMDDPSDYVAVSVSDDGGSNWTELTRISGWGNDDKYYPMNFDISAYISDATRIRFKTSPTLANEDHVFIDDVEIYLTGCN